MKKILPFLLISTLMAFSSTVKSQIDYGSNPLVGKYIDVNDIKVYYEIYGTGEPLLLLHGNGGSMESFEFQIPELSKHFQVIAVDSRGQGRTTDSDKEITYALMASDMNELIDKLKLGSVYVLGWSDGGNIGLELAFAHPEKVKKLITFGANFSHENFLAPFDSTIVMDKNDPLVVGTTDWLQKRTARASARPSPMPEISPVTQKKLADLMEKYPNFTVDQLKQINVPVLVAAGDHDLIALDQTVELFKNLPHAQLMVIPGATHIVLIEQPDLVNSEIVRFLNTPYRDINGYYFISIPR
jgi:pimeloyl-ACP methyl ester carboxylesterase